MHRIFRDSPIPRYIQLADLFRQRIARGIWQQGLKLPSLDELAKEYDVARVTLRQAMDVLSREGLVSMQQGRGTLVTAPASDNRWLNVETTLDDLHAVYLDTRPELSNLSEDREMPVLGPKEGSPAPAYRHLRRLHARNGIPYCLISLHLDERIFRRAPARFRREIVISLLRDMPDVKVAKAWQTLTIGTADMELAARLDIPVNSPTAEVRRVFNDPQGMVLYCADVSYRGDFIRVEMDLRVRKS